MDGCLLKAKIDNRKIYFLRFIFEGYGHLAWLSTLKDGVAVLHTSREREKLVKEIVEMLGDKIGFEGWI